MNQEITPEQYWQIVGLMAIAKTGIDRLKEVEQSMRAVLGVTKEDEEISGIGDPHHIGDAIYSEYSVRELLEKLGVTVMRPGGTEEE